MHEFTKKIGGSAGVAKDVYEAWGGTPEYQRIKAEEARRLVAEYEALTVDTKPGSWCDRALAFLRRAHGLAAVLPDPLGCLACKHPDCGRYEGPRSWECRAMPDNACARNAGVGACDGGQPE